MKKFKVMTFGCRTNQYESEAYANQLRKMGYGLAQDGEEADLCIVNTCTVTETAENTSRREIRSLLKDHPAAKIVVTGCMAERAPHLVSSLHPKIQIVPNKEKEDLIAQVFPDEPDLPEFRLETFEGHTRAFVKVQDGCNSYCTYCIIPYVRGRSRSRQIGDVVSEVQTLVAQGYKEVVITGINVGDFDGGGKLADLVRAVDAVPGLERLRISSIDPDEVDEDLADAVLHGKTTCPSMHIVLQSGSNVILKRMNRKYTRQIFLETVEKMVQKNPDFTVTTDVIVGFPGETEADFEDTKEIVKKVRFAKVHMFPYSPREKTRAALYPNQIPQAVMKERKQILLRLAEQVAFDLRGRFLGRELPVLLEGETQGELISGHTPNFLRVWVPKEGRKSNEIVNVFLIENRPDGFLGRCV